MTIDTHWLPVPVNSAATHLLPERNLEPPLHDTGKECGQISYRYESLFISAQCLSPPDSNGHSHAIDGLLKFLKRIFLLSEIITILVLLILDVPL